MSANKFTRLTPFLVIAIILSYTWYVIITNEFFATTKHQIALGIFVVNIAVYFIKFKYGVLLTGLFLILATFNLLALFPEIIYSSFFLGIRGKGFSTPSIQGKSLLLFIFYLILNARYLMDLYFDSRLNKK
jgi:hypothetical protein